MPTRNPLPNRREKIIDAALGVFAEKGLYGATTKDLAAAAGIVPGLLYHYFESKEQLLLTVIRERGFFPQMRDILQNAPAEQPVQDVLVALCNNFAALLSEREALVRVVIREAQGHPSIALPFAEFVSEGARLLNDFLRTRVETGELRAHDSNAVARVLLFSIVMGQLTQSSDESFRSSLVDVTLSGLRPRER